jgi:hypothetical protein
MSTKLTLSLDSSVIESAKRNLQTKEKSLSSLIEDYFKALLATKTKKSQNTPIVDELSGVASLPKNVNKNDVISDYLLEKYQ